eukprot:4670256-Amphidinium_carterae.1
MSLEHTQYTCVSYGDAVLTDNADHLWSNLDNTLGGAEASPIQQLLRSTLLHNHLSPGTCARLRRRGRPASSNTSTARAELAIGC